MGATGLLGSNLCQIYTSLGFKVLTFSRNNFYFNDSFLPKIPQRIGKFLLINNLKPDIIINCIAEINLSRCEENWDYAFDINVRIATELAQLSGELGAYYIHISTDHYYNDSNLKHNEIQNVELLNNYAKSKYLAEQAISQSMTSNFLIARTNIIGFKHNKLNSFLDWLVISLLKNEKISLFTDYITSPISIRLFAEILLESFNLNLSGIYNIASSNCISKYDFGIDLATKFGLDFSNVSPGSLMTLNQSSGLKRAGNLSLDVSKIENELSKKMPTVQESINSLYHEYLGVNYVV
jgi:dTDP-4-dehydrorhamnose reductase